MRRPAVSPHDPKVVVEGCDMTGAYVTKDGGESWRMFNLGAPPSAFAFDPRDPKVLYAAAGALWRSEDGGRRWTMVFPDPYRNTVVHAWTDHADFVLTTDDPVYPGSGRDVDIHALAVDPADSNRLALALSSAESPRPGSPAAPTRLLASEDRGRSFKLVGELGIERAFAIDFDDRSGTREIRVAAESGTYESAGGDWRRFDAPAPGMLTSASFARDASGRFLLYATTVLEAGPRGGIHVSEDGGRTWRAANASLLDAVSGLGEGESWGDAKGSRPALGPVAASARHPLVAYVGLRGLRLRPQGPKANGIAKTVDGGRSWNIVHAEADAPSPNLEGSWIERRAAADGYSIWFDAPYDLAVAPADPDVCFATDLFRTYRTTDGGKTWRQVSSASREEGRWASRGLDVTTSYGVHFDPFDAERVFISYTDIGLFRSEDAGGSWTSSVTGVPLRWRNTTYWVDFDPEVPGLMWGAFSATHDLPRPKMWRHRDPDTFGGGVGVSRDGGRTWTRAGTGMPEAAVTHLLVDPRSPKGRRTLYACAFGRGVFKSVDGGATWTLKNAGVAEKQPFAWRIVRAVDATLYLIVSRRSERGEIGDGRDGALYRSRDGAEHWTRLALPPGTNGPNGLAVDPEDPRRLYLAAWGRATRGGDTGGGIFLSADGGATWRHVLREYQHVYDVTVDPRDPSVLYASGFDQSALRSRDRGLTWTRLRGFNFKWGHRVLPDPRDPGMVYVTTFGGSVWHGPAAGDEAAAEDVVPSERFRSGGPHPVPARLGELVEANITAVHAYQILLARKADKGDPACWPREAPPNDALEALVRHQTSLLAADPGALRAWVAGQPSAFDPAQDLRPLLAAGLGLPERLPVNVFAAYLQAQAPQVSRAEVLSVANLYQTVLEVERDGDRLQDLFRLYIALGLPVYVGPLGLPGSDADFLAVGGRLEGRSCASPVGTAEGPAPAEGGRGGPFLHHGPPLVFPIGLRAHRDRDVRPREPACRVPAVRGRGADLLPGREGLLRRRPRLEAGRDAVGGAPSHRGRPRGPAPDGRGLSRRGHPRLRLRRRARPGRRRQRKAREGARGGAGLRLHGRGGRAPAGRGSRPGALPLSRRHPHDRGLPPAHGQGMAQAAGRGPRAGPGGLKVEIRIFETKAEMAEAAAERAAAAIREAIAARDRAHVIAATGASQFEFLEALAKASGIAWEKVAFFHLDEYVGLPGSHPASFRRYLKERIGLRVHPGAFHFIAGDAADPRAECRRVGEILARHPIDVAFVGIGENGHLAFNDPPADFEAEEPYLVVRLDEACRRQQMGEGWFRRLEDVPAEAISMSIRQILKSREIVCVVPDERKARAVAECLEGPVSPLRPASILKTHPCATVYLDRSSASLLRGREGARP
jgi:6-phosphogluconolactonase/glucosamine-6-phosphate isomerase/deaminase/photosystem II stability/assembly factor-like uncharacterized protein